MFQRVELQLVRLEAELDQEWRAFASQQQELDRLLREGHRPGDNEMILTGLRLLNKQLECNRVRRFAAEAAEIDQAH